MRASILGNFGNVFSLMKLPLLTVETYSVDRMCTEAEKFLQMFPVETRPSGHSQERQLNLNTMCILQVLIVTFDLHF